MFTKRQNTLTLINVIFFTLMISCSGKFLKKKPQKSEVNQNSNNNTINFTLNGGNLTITNGNFTYGIQNLNLTLAKRLIQDEKDIYRNIAEINHPYLNRINNDLKNGTTPNFTLPNYMGRQAQYEGQGNFVYNNLTNGHSLTIHFEGVRFPLNNNQTNSTGNERRNRTKKHHKLFGGENEIRLNGTNSTNSTSSNGTEVEGVRSFLG